MAKGWKAHKYSGPEGLSRYSEAWKFDEGWSSDGIINLIILANPVCCTKYSSGVLCPTNFASVYIPKRIFLTDTGVKEKSGINHDRTFPLVSSRVNR